MIFLLLGLSCVYNVTFLGSSWGFCVLRNLYTSLQDRLLNPAFRCFITAAELKCLLQTVCNKRDLLWF